MEENALQPKLRGWCNRHDLSHSPLKVHYCVFVMIGPKTDIETAVELAMAPFDENLEVEPYRIHFDHVDVKRMADHYGADPAYLHELAGRMPDWSGCAGGVDRDGLYQVIA